MGHKGKLNDDKKSSEQLKVDHKPEEQTDSAAKEKKVKMVKKKKKKAKTDSNDEIKFDELISEPQQVSYTVEEPDTIKDMKAVQSTVEITDVDNQKEEEASVPVDMKSSDNLPIIKELSDDSITTSALESSSVESNIASVKGPKIILEASPISSEFVPSIDITEAETAQLSEKESQEATDTIKNPQEIPEKEKKIKDNVEQQNDKLPDVSKNKSVDDAPRKR